jgi:uncharacterized membrane protein
MELPPWLESLDMPPTVVVMLLAAAPISEVRGALPVGYVHYHMPLHEVIPLAMICSLIAVLPVLLLFERVADWLAGKPVWGGFLSWLVRRARSKEKWIKRWGSVALVFFVAVPLPGSGVWTGSLIAAVFGMRFWPSVGYLALGVVLQTALVLLATLLGLEIFLAFKVSTV